MAPHLCVHIPGDQSPMQSPGLRELVSPHSEAASNQAEMAEKSQRSPKKNAEFGNLLDSSLGLRQALAADETRHAQRMNTSPKNTSRACMSPLIESSDSPLKLPEPRGVLGDAPNSPDASSLASPSNFSEERARLRGDGEAIGKRGRASLGIPWRQIPVHDGSGQLRLTGDPTYASPERRKNEVVVCQTRKVSACSPKLGSGQGMREILTPGERAHARGTISGCKEKTDKVPARILFPSEGDDEQDRHFSFKPQKKGVSQECNTKDKCPYFRTDSSVDQQTMQSSAKLSRVLDGNLQGSGASPKGGCHSPTSVEYPLADKSVEARRDWKVLHGNPHLEDIAAEVPILRNQLQALSPGHDGSAAGGARGVRTPLGSQQARWK
eukprot:CAMPEP_0172671122 /NCGR_PEP_ID=MMETSP1074-20121228/10715_1 /TAXON_ID=2916 /ORGANISM="Ceratium fusus, Strain PA161109" /LENGTH=380 /DNA_ID=CAMNT_0013488121 /DNA_START=17 /DNA_END=1159 /DNA_ORIENTATION=+